MAHAHQANSVSQKFQTYIGQSSFPPKRESIKQKSNWTPACARGAGSAGMTTIYAANSKFKIAHLLATVRMPPCRQYHLLRAGNRCHADRLRARTDCFPC